MPTPSTTPSTPSGAWLRWGHLAILALVLAASFAVKLTNLGHLSIKGLDESFHALVARNLLKHPLTPTLVDQPVLPYDYTDWNGNHVWLHKPVMPMWQIALSFALLGVNTFALRLPSAILATAAVGLTYAIGRELLGRTAGLIAATMQAIAPVIVTVVQGYLFSDHVDIALLFWTELAVWLLVRSVRTGSWRWALLAGAAQGVAFLCKTYPALIVTGVALAAWVLTRARFRWSDDGENDTRVNAPTTSGEGGEPAPPPRRFGGRHVLCVVAGTILTAAPWMIYIAARFPKEFAWENLQIFRHLSRDIEGFAAPWDRLVFDYSVNVYHLFYPSVLAAAVVLAVRAWRERNLALAIVLAWGLGVLLPHVLATSKTPTATMIGWPAFFLLYGEMVRRAVVRGDGMCLGAWAGAALVGVLNWHAIPRSGFGYPDPPQAGVLFRQNLWVVWHVLAALAAAGVVAWVTRTPKMTRQAYVLVAAIAACASVAMGARVAWDGWRVTQVARRDTPTFVKLAERADRWLPAEAVLLVDERQKLERVMVMFFTGRPAYAVTPETWRETAERVTAAGGRPFVVSHRPMPLHSMFRVPEEDRVVYDPASPLPASGPATHSTSASPATVPRPAQ